MFLPSPGVNDRSLYADILKAEKPLKRKCTDLKQLNAYLNSV